MGIAARKDSGTVTLGDAAAVLTLGAVALLFGAVASRLIYLGATARPVVRLSMAEPIGGSFARPDIVDRRGRLLASDVEVHSLYADPMLVLDADETVEKLASVLPDLGEAELRRGLADPSRRFLWIRRGLAPRVAQQIHALGLPGIGFRKEPYRVYPAGSLAGHVLGAVNVDNKGVAGIERWIDETGRVDAVVAPGNGWGAGAALDIGAQHVLADEFAAAMTRYRAVAAAGLVMDAPSGEVVAAAALPEPIRRGRRICSIRRGSSAFQLDVRAGVDLQGDDGGDGARWRSSAAGYGSGCARAIGDRGLHNQGSASGGAAADGAGYFYSIVECWRGDAGAAGRVGCAARVSGAVRVARRREDRAGAIAAPQMPKNWGTDVAAVIPRQRPTVGGIDEADARDLLAKLTTLPSPDDPSRPVTLVLDGGVSVLAADDDADRAGEAVPLARGRPGRAGRPRPHRARPRPQARLPHREGVGGGQAGGVRGRPAFNSSPPRSAKTTSSATRVEAVTPRPATDPHRHPNPHDRRPSVKPEPVRPHPPPDDRPTRSPWPSSLRQSLADAHAAAARLVAALKGRKKEQRALAQVYASLKSSDT